jgi:hypothetical protein
LFGLGSNGQVLWAKDYIVIRRRNGAGMRADAVFSTQSSRIQFDFMPYSLHVLFCVGRMVLGYDLLVLVILKILEN